MAFDIPINFRSTSGYVTDSGVETYSLGEAYPTTRGGFTFGWSSIVSLNTRDRITTQDRRLAGVNFISNNIGPIDFRIDLPSSGSVTLHLAIGDYGSGLRNFVEIFDNMTSLGVIVTYPPNGDTSANQFIDATAAYYSAAAWPGSETGLSLTFASTILKVRIGDPASSALFSTGIAHVRAVQTATAAPLGFGKITANRKYFLPSEAALVLAALESKRRLSRRRFFQWLPGAFWRK